jgi:hypothetical protein
MGDAPAESAGEVKVEAATSPAPDAPAPAADNQEEKKNNEG